MMISLWFQTELIVCTLYAQFYVSNIVTRLTYKICCIALSMLLQIQALLPQLKTLSFLFEVFLVLVI